MGAKSLVSRLRPDDPREGVLAIGCLPDPFGSSREFLQRRPIPALVAEREAVRVWDFGEDLEGFDPLPTHDWVRPSRTQSRRDRSCAR